MTVDIDQGVGSHPEGPVRHLHEVRADLGERSLDSSQPAIGAGDGAAGGGKRAEEKERSENSDASRLHGSASNSDSCGLVLPHR